MKCLCLWFKGERLHENCWDSSHSDRLLCNARYPFNNKKKIIINQKFLEDVLLGEGVILGSSLEVLRKRQHAVFKQTAELCPLMASAEVSLRRIERDCILLVSQLLTWQGESCFICRYRLKVCTNTGKKKTKRFDPVRRMHFTGTVFTPSVSVYQLSITLYPRYTYISLNSGPAPCPHIGWTLLILLLLFLSATTSSRYTVCPWQTASAQSPSWKCLLIREPQAKWMKVQIQSSALIYPQIHTKLPGHKWE